MAEFVEAIRTPMKRPQQKAPPRQVHEPGSAGSPESFVRTKNAWLFGIVRPTELDALTIMVFRLGFFSFRLACSCAFRGQRLTVESCSRSMSMKRHAPEQKPQGVQSRFAQRRRDVVGIAELRIRSIPCQSNCEAFWGLLSCMCLFWPATVRGIFSLLTVVPSTGQRTKFSWQPRDSRLRSTCWRLRQARSHNSPTENSAEQLRGLWHWQRVFLPITG